MKNKNIETLSIDASLSTDAHYHFMSAEHLNTIVHGIFGFKHKNESHKIIKKYINIPNEYVQSEPVGFILNSTSRG